MSGTAFFFRKRHDGLHSFSFFYKKKEKYLDALIFLCDGVCWELQLELVL